MISSRNVVSRSGRSQSWRVFEEYINQFIPIDHLFANWLITVTVNSLYTFQICLLDCFLIVFWDGIVITKLLKIDVKTNRVFPTSLIKKPAGPISLKCHNIINLTLRTFFRILTSYHLHFRNPYCLSLSVWNRLN